jgi:hypothetical protein
MSGNKAHHLDPIAREIEEQREAEFLADLFVPIVQINRNIPLRWIVAGLLPRGYLAILAGEPKSGKTSLATALALNVATARREGALPFGGSARSALVAQCPIARQVRPSPGC